MRLTATLICNKQQQPSPNHNTLAEVVKHGGCRSLNVNYPIQTRSLVFTAYKCDLKGDECENARVSFLVKGKVAFRAQCPCAVKNQTSFSR